MQCSVLQNLLKSLLLITAFLIQSCGGQGPNTNSLASNNNNSNNGNANTTVDGKTLFQSSCAGCHSIGTEVKVGPGLGGRFDSTIELADNTTTKADEAYIRESIVNAQAKIPKGTWAKPMPSFTSYKAEELDALVDYIKTLK